MDQLPWGVGWGDYKSTTLGGGVGWLQISNPGGAGWGGVVTNQLPWGVGWGGYKSTTLGGYKSAALGSYKSAALGYMDQPPSGVSNTTFTFSFSTILGCLPLMVLVAGP